MQTYEVKLKPKGFIQSFQNPSFPSSTTLFGAICWGIKAIHGENELKNFLSSFSDSPPLVITSSFPLLQKEDFHCRCFPKPKLPSLEPGELRKIAGSRKSSSPFQIASEYKSFKGIAFLSESLFLEVLAGKGEKALFSEYLEGKIEKVGDIALTKEESERLWGEKPLLLPRGFPMARNKVDRLLSSSTGAGEFFYDFKLPFLPEMSLFFLLKVKDITLLKPVLRFLEDNGIGGERAIGMNHFSIQEGKLESSLPTEGKKLVTLSRWKVNPEELDMNKKEEFRYELLPLRGKVETGFDFKDKKLGSREGWKGKTLYFAEGSILVVNKGSQSHYGSIWQSLKFEDKKIMDYGIAFPAFFTEK